MKRLILLLLAALLLVRPPLFTAEAEELRYAVAPDSNVWFYASESEEEKLFLLPETYYVRVLAQGEEYTAVEYLVNEPPYRKLVGYCRTQALKFVGFLPERPYLKKLLSVSYTLPDAGGGIDGNPFGSIEKTFVYYGYRYENGQLYLYVYDGQSFGYIPADERPAFERNDDWLYEPEEPAVDVGGTPASPPSALHVVLLCLAAGAAVAVAVFVLRGKRRSPPSDDSDP